MYVMKINSGDTRINWVFLLLKLLQIVSKKKKNQLQTNTFAKSYLNSSYAYVHTILAGREENTTPTSAEA